MKFLTAVGEVEFNPLYLATHPRMKEALETGMIEGVPFTVTGSGKDLQPGDTYLAERRSGVIHLLTCQKNRLDKGWVEAVEPAYSFDTGECVKIELLMD